jgi:acyl-CoA thioesterase
VSHNAAHDVFSADAASNAWGIELIEAAEGSAVTMVNGHDIAHDGYVLLLADTTFAARSVERTRCGRSGIYDVTVLPSSDMVAGFGGRSRVIGK